MRFSAAAVSAFAASGITLLCSEVSAFTPSRQAFVSRSAVVSSNPQVHKASCACPACMGVHQPGCACATCARSFTILFADTTAETEEVASDSPVEAVATEVPAEVDAVGAEVPAEVDAVATEVPAEVEAMDGIASDQEAHNAERPAREQIKKKRAPKGKPLSEFAAGDSVKATVKTITSYGAFLDIGAQTDALVHISRVAAGFVKDVNEVLSIGDEVDARIIKIDTDKNQIAISLLTQDEEDQEAESRPRKQDRSRGGQQRRDDSAVLAALQAKGWEAGKFVEGEVVSTVDFGAFVRVDASKLNAEVEGVMDGLVHISSLSVGRADTVSAFAKVGDKVQVRCKGIQGGKVSLSMIAPEDEQQPRGSRQAVVEGAKDWKEQLEKARADMPEFSNAPVVVDMRE